MLTTSVHAERQGPSITTRSPDWRTRSNSSRNGPTAPPGLARMRISARAGRIAANSAAVATTSLMTAIRMRGSFVRRTALWPSYAEICGKVSSILRAGDAGLGESCHPGVTGERGADQWDRDPCARRFAEAHVQVEQRIQLEFAQEIAVAGFGRDVPGAAMIERACIETRERQHRRGRHETVEQHRDIMPPGGEHRAGDRREFAAAECCRHRQRVAENVAMETQRGLDRRAFARQPVVVDA